MPIRDPFSGYSRGFNRTFENAMTVAPSDYDDLPVIPSAFRVRRLDLNECGSLRVTFLNDAVVDLYVMEGITEYLSVKKIWFSGTDFHEVTLLW